MRIFFVGVHNKPNLQPLDSQSKSGKLVDKILLQLSQYNCLKTNLYSCDSMNDLDINAGADAWAALHNYHKGRDLIVALGELVKKEFVSSGYTIIALKHPSAVWSTVNQNKYVVSATEKIIHEINVL